ncbi:nicotinate-nucleotide--dimethylbenzimidazole phosphoribosyltransferase [Motilibacter deserti]|uniref:Nicotinate-nucleotide--dimethylbenzimidazole phosphoribosyltransferase n=1 Tax=Motilibacter deserti TaxID=2714956 RepID=A0ABX0GPR6_9ACTN|nr:nicotinate-nucleotide--dimethylbenzimidazole phosphoribosyltransferase [Motilibacter deserti]NHC12443.1 nicotinate-nucleotide--dimethylbenzimidazole phosphoribosyltransferase [Motilibacter deserti]
MDEPDATPAALDETDAAAAEAAAPLPETPDSAAAEPALTVEELNLLGGRVEHPDEGARQETRARQAELAKPVGALGSLEDLSVWAAGVQRTCPPRPFERIRVVVFAGDHGIAAGGVSAYPAEVTAHMVRAFLTGTAAVNALARQAGAEVRVLDMSVDADLSDVPEDVTRHKVRRGTGRIDVEDAMTRDEAATALLAGMAVADEEVDAGADLLIAGDMGIANTTAAAALVGVLTGSDAATVCGRGTGIDDRGWMRKCAAIRDAMRRGRPHMADPIALLAAIGGPDLAATTGFLLQAAVRRTPVVLDGVVPSTCAVLAHRVAPRASLWWLAGHRSTEPAQTLALQQLALEPVLDLKLRLGEGTGALLAVPILQAATATCSEMATLEELGGSHGAEQP